MKKLLLYLCFSFYFGCCSYAQKHTLTKEEYDLYQKTKSYILEQNSQTEKTLIKSYENRINFLDSSFNELKIQYLILDSASKEHLIDIETQLYNVATELNRSKANLDQTQIELTQVKNDLSQKDNKQKRNKLIAGLGGLGLGFLTGFIIAK